MNQQYLDQFFRLQCAGDVMNVVSPGVNTGPIRNMAKEITETWAVIRKIRGITLKDPNKYILVDTCAGNALTSVLAAFLLPIKEAIAVDKHVRSRAWQIARKFTYMNGDIQQTSFESFLRDMSDDIILISVHPCGPLASRNIELYKTLPNIKHLVIIPCCSGKMQGVLPAAISKKIGKYLVWCYKISKGLEEYGTFDMKVDNNCLSPCNCIITASKINS